MKIRFSAISALAGAMALLGSPSQGAEIFWAVWSPQFTVGTPSGGVATAKIGTTSLTYSGQLLNVLFDLPSWEPQATFKGGAVGNTPTTRGGMVKVTGGSLTVNTIKFATPVTDPVLAIWSLGHLGTKGSFRFFAPIRIESGGPTKETGGTKLVSADKLLIAGEEQSGTVQFSGTFDEISWTNPDYEDWYGFTVGIANADVSAAPLPQPILAQR